MTVHRLWNRTLALGLAVLPLLAAFWVATAWLYDAHFVLAAQTARATGTLRQFEGILDQRAEIERATARSSYDTPNYYWRGASGGDAAAELQGQLTTLIDAVGGEAQHFELLAATTDDAGPAINLRLTLRATATQLIEALYSIDRFRPYLFVDQLHVKALDQRPRSAQAGEAMLHVSMDVHGYLEPPTGQGAQ